MARQKRQKSKHHVDDLLQIIKDYEADTGADEIDMRKVAKWAMERGRWHPPRYNPLKACAKELSSAAREEYYIDPQGREVRKRHCYTIIEADGQRAWLWVDITTAKPDPMHRSLQSRRRSALGDVIQLDRDLASFNENNAWGAALQMSFNFDEDLEELKHPIDYPEEPEEPG
jgi:hypothetical protein